MNKHYSNYVQFLASSHNILYIGRESEKIYDETSIFFSSASKIDMTKEMLEKINAVLLKRHITIAIIDATANDALVQEYYTAIENFKEDVLTILLYEPRNYKKVFEIVPKADSVVTYPIDKNIFHKKLFTLLSRPYTINSIGRRNIVMKHTHEEESIDKFLDSYEASALFVADELVLMVDELDAGNLTHNFFVNIADELDAVAHIFSKTPHTKSVAPIYTQLAIYLKGLELESVEPANLHGFNYLSEILSDISVYLISMFLDRVFKNVAIFKDSLQSNIDFMQHTLSGVDETDDGSELDFF
ncbi:MAG: hypothetical protein Q9M40_02810 [Sulfurimonas sp.]|nr:hypothetical protein [Sulfurimonas sp.]